MPFDSYPTWGRLLVWMLLCFWNDACARRILHFIGKNSNFSMIPCSKISHRVEAMPQITLAWYEKHLYIFNFNHHHRAVSSGNKINAYTIIACPSIVPSNSTPSKGVSDCKASQDMRNNKWIEICGWKEMVALETDLWVRSTHTRALKRTAECFHIFCFPRVPHLFLMEAVRSHNRW